MPAIPEELNSDLVKHFLDTPVKKYSDENMPFFILGCVRSGTTLLRDLLRDHPRLECPEETHFFRWADPFGSPRFNNYYKSKLFKLHREMDGVDPMRFHIFLETCKSREHLSYEYGQDFLNAIGKPDARLFDKTPQNVYGIFLLSALYPKAKYVHIYRNPLNVVTSLMEGKVMPKHGIIGGINYWVESMLLLEQYKMLHPERLLEIKYEELTANPQPFLRQMLEFVGEDPDLLPDQTGNTHKERNKYKKKLSSDEINLVVEACEPYFSQLGYSVE